MNFVLAAGGTGGHMIPAHALAAELKRRGHGVLLITDERGARFPGLFEGVPVHILPAGRLGGGPIGWLKAAALGAQGQGRSQAPVSRAPSGRGDRLRRLSGLSVAARGERTADSDRAPRAECGARAGSTGCSPATPRRSASPMTRSTGSRRRYQAKAVRRRQSGARRDRQARRAALSRRSTTSRR